MIIEIHETPSDKEPYSLDIKSIKIGFIVGESECEYDYDLDKYIDEKPFETLYTGEEYVKISCEGNYAFPEFLKMWEGFITQYDIKEVTTSKTLKNDLVA